MKNLLSMLALVIAILSVNVTAEAFSHYATVVNCNEWISLREYPSTSAPRLTKIPLGATVEVHNYSGRDDDQGYRNGFIYTYYNGMTGWCLMSYLRIGSRIY